MFVRSFFPSLVLVKGGKMASKKTIAKLPAIDCSHHHHENRKSCFEFLPRIPISNERKTKTYNPIKDFFIRNASKERYIYTIINILCDIFLPPSHFTPPHIIPLHTKSRQYIVRILFILAAEDMRKQAPATTICITFDA